MARHDDPVGAQGRQGRDRRRRSGLHGPDGDEAQCEKGPPACRRIGDRGLCRGDRRCLYPVRAAGKQAGALQGSVAARRGRTGEGLAHRQISAQSGGDDDRRRQNRHADHHRQWRCAGTAERHCRDRFGRELRALRRARASGL